MAKKRNDILPESDSVEDTLIEISSTPDVEVEQPQTINETLSEIRKLPGVTGYIMRNEAGATIDINEPDKIIDYAMLSTELINTIGIVEQQFTAGSVECIFAEGKDAKVLCIANDIYKISVFMNNSADHEDIRLRLRKALVNNLVK